VPSILTFSQCCRYRSHTCGYPRPAGSKPGLAEPVPCHVLFYDGRRPAQSIRDLGRCREDRLDRLNPPPNFFFGANEFNIWGYRRINADDRSGPGLGPAMAWYTSNVSGAVHDNYAVKWALASKHRHLLASIFFIFKHPALGQILPLRIRWPTHVVVGQEW